MKMKMLIISILLNTSITTIAQVKTTHIVKAEIGGGKDIAYDVIEENGLKRYVISFFFQNQEYSSIVDIKSISCFSKECLTSLLQDLKDANASLNERTNISWKKDGYKYMIDKYDFTNSLYLREIDGTSNYTKLSKEELEKLILQLVNIEFGSEKTKSGVVYNPNELTKAELYKNGIEEFKKSNYVKSDSLFTIYKTKYPTEVYGYYWCFRSKSVMDSTMEGGLAINDCLMFIKSAEIDVDKNKSTLITAYGYIAAYSANIPKDLPKALEYLNKIIQIDPTNLDAQKYAEIIEKSLRSRKRN